MYWCYQTATRLIAVGGGGWVAYGVENKSHVLYVAPWVGLWLKITVTYASFVRSPSGPACCKRALSPGRARQQINEKESQSMVSPFCALTCSEE